MGLLDDLLTPPKDPNLKGGANYKQESNLRSIAYDGPEYAADSTPEQERIWAERDMRQWEESYNQPGLTPQQKATLLAHKPGSTKASTDLSDLLQPTSGDLSDLLKKDPNDMSDLLAAPGLNESFESGLNTMGANVNRGLIGITQMLPMVPDSIKDSISDHFRSQAESLDEHTLSPEKQANASFLSRAAQTGGTLVGMAPALVFGLPGAAGAAALASFGAKGKEMEEGLSDAGAYLTTPLNVMVDTGSALLPIFGSSIGKAAVIGGATNVATSMFEEWANKIILEKTGDKKFAEGYHPFDLTQRFLDGIVGAVMGGAGKAMDIRQGRYKPDEANHIMEAFRDRHENDIAFMNQNLVHHNFQSYQGLSSIDPKAPWRALVDDLNNDAFVNENGTVVSGKDKLKALLDYVLQHGQTEEQKSQARFYSSLFEFVTKNERLVKEDDPNLRGHWEESADGLLAELGLAHDRSSPKTFMHEFTHLLTSKMTDQVLGPPELRLVPTTPEEMRVHEMIKDFNELFETFRPQLQELTMREIQSGSLTDKTQIHRQRYGFTNLAEFMSELMTSKIFREHLAKIKLSPDERAKFNTKFQGAMGGGAKKLLGDTKLTDFHDKTVLDLAMFKMANIVDAMTSGHRFGQGGHEEFARTMKSFFGTDMDIEDYATRFGQGSVEAQMSDVINRKMGQILAASPDAETNKVKILSLVPDLKWKAMIETHWNDILANRDKFIKAWEDFTVTPGGKAQMGQDMRTMTKIVDDLFKGRSLPSDDMSDSGTNIMGADQLSMIKDKTKGGQLVKAFNDKVNEYRRFKKQLYHDFLNFQKKFAEADFDTRKETMMEARFWDQLESRKVLEQAGLQWPTEQMMKDRGVSQKAIDAYLDMAKGYDYIWMALNGAGKTIAELNADAPFQLKRIPGFMPHFHEGNVKIRIKITTQDEILGVKGKKTEKVIMIGRDTIFGANRLIKKIQKLNDPNIQLLPDPHTGKPFTLRSDRSPELSISTALVENYNSYKNWTKLDPVLATKIAQLDIDDARGYAKTLLQRKNVGGYTNAAIGNPYSKDMGRFLGIPNKAANDAFGIYEKYAHSAADFVANAHFVNDVTRPILSNSTDDYHIGRGEITQNLRNARNYMDAQSRNFTGENLNHFKFFDDKVEKLAVALQLHPHAFKFLNRSIRGLLSMIKLRTVRNWLANINQPVNGLGMLYHFAVQNGLDTHKASPFTSLAWAYKQLLVADDAEGRMAMQWAKDNHVVDPQTTLEIHSDQKIDSPIIRKVDNWLLGGINNKIETFSRTATFLMSYHYMKKIYNNKVNALEAADRATRAIMVNYDPSARPHMFQNFGIAGEFMSPFAVYRNAYLGNTFLMIRDMARNPTKLESFKPFLVGQAMYILQAGMIGMIGIAEYDFIAQSWNQYMPDDWLKLPLSSEWTYNMPDWLSFGVLTEASKNIPGMENGFMAGTSATAPSLTNVTNPPLLPFIQAMIAFGAIPVKEGLALITDYPGASSDDMYKALKQLLPPHFYPALDEYFTGRSDIGYRANSLEGMIDREPADVRATALTGAISPNEWKNRRAIEIDQKKQMTMKSVVKKYVDKVADYSIGAPLGMPLDEAFAKAKNVDPTLEYDEFLQQVEKERISRLTSKERRPGGSDKEAIQRMNRMERYGQ